MRLKPYLNAARFKFEKLVNSKSAQTMQCTLMESNGCPITVPMAPDEPPAISSFLLSYDDGFELVDMFSAIAMNALAHHRSSQRVAEWP
jgi:hypothetical protein